MELDEARPRHAGGCPRHKYRLGLLSCRHSTIRHGHKRHSLFLHPLSMTAKRFDISAASLLESRDGGITKGGLVRNGFTDLDGAGERWANMRPSLATGVLGSFSGGLGLFQIGSNLYGMGNNGTANSWIVSTSGAIPPGTLQFFQQPISGQEADNPINPTVAVGITGKAGVVTVFLAQSDSGGSLYGDLTASMIGGTAYFTNLRISGCGYAYKLGATAGGFASNTSGAFSVSKNLPMGTGTATSTGTGADANDPYYYGQGSWRAWDGISFSGVPALGTPYGPLQACLSSYAPITWGNPTGMRVCVWDGSGGAPYFIHGPDSNPGTFAQTAIAAITTRSPEVACGTFS